MFATFLTWCADFSSRKPFGDDVQDFFGVLLPPRQNYWSLEASARNSLSEPAVPYSPGPRARRFALVHPTTPMFSLWHGAEEVYARLVSCASSKNSAEKFLTDSTFVCKGFPVKSSSVVLPCALKQIFPLPRDNQSNARRMFWWNQNGGGEEQQRPISCQCPVNAPCEV